MSQRKGVASREKHRVRFYKSVHRYGHILNVGKSVIAKIDHEEIESDPEDKASESIEVIRGKVHDVIPRHGGIRVAEG